jgi:putative cardiolipin synthase
VTAIALAGCAADPVARPRGEPGQARPPAATGLLADAETQVRRDHGPDRSGFHLLDRNEDGLRWRLALMDAATRSLDLQYYVWWADESGELLMKHLIDAANRGVKVRLILDDLSTILKDAAQVAERDRQARLDAPAFRSASSTPGTGAAWAGAAMSSSSAWAHQPPHAQC